jgi:hypothetical protein
MPIANVIKQVFFHFESLHASGSRTRMDGSQVRTMFPSTVTREVRAAVKTFSTFIANKATLDCEIWGVCPHVARPIRNRDRLSTPIAMLLGGRNWAKWAGLGTV